MPGLSSWRVLVGRGDTPEDITVPDWMLPKDTKLGITRERIEWEGESVKCGINPDMIILQGWPATVAHPAGPVRSSLQGQVCMATCRRARVHVGPDLGEDCQAQESEI